MKVTFILRDLSDDFFQGRGDSLPGLINMPDPDKFSHLSALAHRHPSIWPMKIGNGSFRDRVELNQILRRSPSVSFTLSPRKGYQVAFFEIA